MLRKRYVYVPFRRFSTGIPNGFPHSLWKTHIVPVASVDAAMHHRPPFEPAGNELGSRKFPTAGHTRLRCTRGSRQCYRPTAPQTGPSILVFRVPPLPPQD